jgi:pyrroloquinoline quinone biosynthesis protein B
VRIRVLGAGAGGGLPQWNCGCGNCSAARDGTLAPATQASVAVAGEPGAWVLLNVSPDARVQLASWPEARPQGRRHSPVVAVVLTSGELDHCLGLFSLRERQPLAVYATEAVRDGICRLNVMARTLEPHVAWRLLPLGREVDVHGRRGEPTGLAVEARPVPGRVPRHLRDAVAPSEGDVVAIRVRDLECGGRLAYCPSAADVDDRVGAALDGADCVFFDGTFWSHDEVPGAPAMGHASLGGPTGALERLAGAVRPDARRILTHLNNTNPLFDPHSAERRAAGAAGWEVAADGLEVTV